MIKRRSTELLVASLILIALQATNIAIWIRAFNAGASQPERVALYLSRLPLGLGALGARPLTQLAMLAGLAGAACAIPAARARMSRVTFLAWAALSVNAVLVLWYLFILM